MSLQTDLKDKGVKLLSEAAEESPYKSAMVCDPDGNLILFDQM